jgi:cyclomaltodextrinase
VFFPLTLNIILYNLVGSASKDEFRPGSIPGRNLPEEFMRRPRAVRKSAHPLALPQNNCWLNKMPSSHSSRFSACSGSFIIGAFLAVALCLSSAHGQDSVDVTFRYLKGSSPTVYLVGEFNGWNNTASPMTYDGTGAWTRTVRLRLGGNPAPALNGIPGAWQYKFYYTGVGEWPNDPLNPHVNSQDNGNTYLYVTDPTVYQLLPNQRQPLVGTSTPTVTAFVFPRVGAQVDSSAFTIVIDGTAYQPSPEAYNSSTHQLAWTLPAPLPNGSHSMILTAHSTLGGIGADTVSFVTQAGYVQITTQGGYTTRNPLKLLRGTVGDTSIHQVLMIRNGIDTTQVAVSAGYFSILDTLREGENSFQAFADSAGTLTASDPVSFMFLVDHGPYAVITASDAGPSIQLSAGGSTDPDSGQTATLAFTWSEDPANPAQFGGVDGATAPTLLLTKPAVPGTYFFGLIVKDVDGHADTTRSYVVVQPGGSVVVPSYASNPDWAKTGRIYFLFPKAASQAGTINEAAKRLQYIHDLGFSVIWMMPVMKNAYPIDNNYGPGYNIVDFYNVAPEYGTNADFKDFVDQAHALGMKVILDVTPNHTSRYHPWSQDAHTFGQDSRYWTWYEHSMITANTNGLGDCLDAGGFNYYCGFSDQLLNLNWDDPDMRAEMINIYKYWITRYGIDGYRFDVYWGPHRRYGEQAMGIPVRKALKHIKPDILLLGEDDGTGQGTEAIYADYTGSVPGGLDASYDFKLYFNQIAGFYNNATQAAFTALHSEIDNGGFYPGPDALYLRFMESQDQDRIAYLYSNNGALDSTTSFERTMPIASVLFTIPGLPMIWNGQEIGFGYGIAGSKEARDRSVINWEYGGKTLLVPHYQKLAWIRGEFPAFTQHKRDTNGDGSVNSSDASDFVRVNSSNTLTYAFLRPYTDQNGLTVVNGTGTEINSTVLNVAAAAPKFSGNPDSVYLNDVYNGTVQRIAVASLGAVAVSLPPYGTAIYTIGASPDTLVLPGTVTSVPQERPTPLSFELGQNYPNPFNPSTTIQYIVGGVTAPSGGEGHVLENVKLEVYDILGRTVATLANGRYPAGRYSFTFDGTHLASGVYFYRLEAGRSVLTRKMILLK